MVVEPDTGIEFQDVPAGHWAYDYIQKLYNAGITKGCAEGFFGPDEPVTRAQMAVFLERGIQGGGFTPPAASGVFADVPVGYWAADWIEQFYQDGVTKGCDTGPLGYCPDQPVVRAEMAVFLLRAKLGSNYTPPSATGFFADVPVTYWAADWVEELYLESITTGCGHNPLMFCPEDSATRAEMAAFLVRTFGL